MREAISSSVLAIVAAAIASFPEQAQAQGVQTMAAEQPLPSPLATAAGEVAELRFARPLSRNEEIALSVCPKSS